MSNIVPTTTTTEFPYITTTPAIPQIRMGLIGAPGTGKTTFALTFPNPLVIDYDGKLPPGTRSIPFCNRTWLRGQSKWRRESSVNFADRDALIYFLREEAPKLPPDTTLILDSWTSVMNRLDMWQDAVKTQVYWSEKKKEVDGFAIHGDRISMAVEIFNLFKGLNCNFIVTMHEQVERTDDGLLTGGIKPLMKGQFADQMAAHLTAFFRMGFDKTFTDTNGYCVKVKADKIWRPITPPGFKVPANVDGIHASYKHFTACL